MDKVPQKEAMDVSASKEVNGRRYSGFNLLSAETVGNLKTIACAGESIITAGIKRRTDLSAAAP